MITDSLFVGGGGGASKGKIRGRIIGLPVY